MTRRALSPELPARALAGAAGLWFVVAAIGHWIFVAYIIGHYGPKLIGSGLQGLGAPGNPGGYVEGDLLGNLTAAAHVVLATVIIGGGPLQLVPWIRARFPAFHRGLGRTYAFAAIVSAAAGIYMIWTRGSVGGIVNYIAITIDGVLVFVCAGFALKYAIARDIRRHRRWAMRLFLVASAVWFYRVGLMGWAMTTGGIGIDWETFTGPFVYFLGFAQYLVPLAILELYLRAKDSGDAAGQVAVASLLVVATVAMSIGIFAATFGMWLPKMS